MCDEVQLEIILSRVARFSEHEFGDSLKDVILYGSYARGDFQDDSDIDIMILVDKDPLDLKRSRATFASLSTDIDLDFDVVSSLHLKDFKSFQQWKKVVPFFMNVEREGESVYA